MRAPDLSRATWRKSSYSNGTGGSCVEIAVLTRTAGNEHAIAVRDSKVPQGPALIFTAPQWRDFTAANQSPRTGPHLNHAQARPPRAAPPALARGWVLPVRTICLPGTLSLRKLADARLMAPAACPAGTRSGSPTRSSPTGGSRSTASPARRSAWTCRARVAAGFGGVQLSRSRPALVVIMPYSIVGGTAGS